MEPAEFAGSRVTFGPVQWRILSELRRSEGKLIPYGRLIFEVYGPRAAPSALGALNRSIFIIRQKLAGSAWHVRRVHGRGVIASRVA